MDITILTFSYLFGPNFFTRGVMLEVYLVSLLCF